MMVYRYCGVLCLAATRFRVDVVHEAGMHKRGQSGVAESVVVNVSYSEVQNVVVAWWRGGLTYGRLAFHDRTNERFICSLYSKSTVGTQYCSAMKEDSLA
jgi:hypothetical protein